jgi:hypothetical protein
VFLNPEEYGNLQNCLYLLKDEELIEPEEEIYTIGKGYWKLTVKGLRLLETNTSIESYMKQKYKSEKKVPKKRRTML